MIHLEGSFLKRLAREQCIEILLEDGRNHKYTKMVCLAVGLEVLGPILCPNREILSALGLVGSGVFVVIIGFAFALVFGFIALGLGVSMAPAPIGACVDDGSSLDAEF